MPILLRLLHESLALRYCSSFRRRHPTVVVALIIVCCSGVVEMNLRFVGSTITRSSSSFPRIRQHPPYRNPPRSRLAFGSSLQIKTSSKEHHHRWVHPITHNVYVPFPSARVTNGSITRTILSTSGRTEVAEVSMEQLERCIGSDGSMDGLRQEKQNEEKLHRRGQWNDSSYDDNDEKVCIKINSNDNNDNNKHLGIIPVIAPNGVPIYRVERGGEVTYHGPGQVVVYPLFDLQQQQREHEKQLVFKPDLHWYIRTLEQIIIDTLQVYNIIGYRDDINTGVWVTEDDAETKDHQSSSNAIYEHRNKIAAIGVSSSRWITTHGFAINVCPDLQYFDTSNIIPCGISHTDPSDDGNAANETEWLSSCPTNTKKKKIRRGVTSIANILRKRGVCESDIPTTQQVSEDIVRNIQTTFQVNIEYCRFVK